jgi:hypothetical protein
MKRLIPSIKLTLTILTLFMTAFMVFGCASKIPHKVVSDYSKRGARLIAVAPVNNHTADEKAAVLLRETVIRELYFKGYPKISPKVIDEKLSSVYGSKMDFKRGDVPPKTMGDLLGVDAVLYCTLTQFKTSYILVYAPVRVSITFELRDTKTGETLWSTRHETVNRSFGLSDKQLEMKSYQLYELAIQEVVDKAMETLPDGPDV